MHPEAMDWIRRHAPADPVDVLDIGGRDINGSARDAFPALAGFTSLDLYDGPGVDIVADAATWTPTREWDVVVSAEVFEHTPEWPAILRTAWAALRPGGLVILTMAGPGRPAHSAIDGGWTLHPGEHYANVTAGDLADALREVGFVEVVTNYISRPGDTRAAARKPLTEETP